MNHQDKEEFDRIVSKTAAELTAAEITFLFARRSYMNKTQRGEFGELMKQKDAQVKEAVNQKEA